MTFTPRQLEDAIVKAWIGTQHHTDWLEDEGFEGDESFDAFFNFEEGWYNLGLDTEFGKVTTVEYGRERDYHDQQYVIIKCDDRFFKVSGYYSSWDGGMYEDPELKEVESAERVETYWRYV